MFVLNGPSDSPCITVVSNACISYARHGYGPCTVGSKIGEQPMQSPWIGVFVEMHSDTVLLAVQSHEDFN